MKGHTRPRSATPPPPPAPPPPPPRRRRGWLLLVLVAFLLLGGLGGALWWRGLGSGAVAPEVKGTNPGSTTSPNRSLCSDDDDPKYLEQLEFGPPIEARFDRRFLDGLSEHPIPQVERYSWQPKELVAVLGEHRMRGQLIAADPEGKTLAVTSFGDSYLHLGPIETLHESTVLICPGGVQMLTWSRKGDRLAVSCGDKVIRFYDVRDLAKIPAPTILESASGLVTSLSFSWDDKYLLGGDNTPKRGIAWVWDTSSRKVVHKLQHIGPVMSVAFSPAKEDYRALTAGGPEDGQLHLWDAVAGEQKGAVDFRPPMKVDLTTAVGEVAFSPDGKRALSCHPDATVRVWDLAKFDKDQQIATLPGHVGSARAAFSPDGKHICTALYDNGVWLWDANSGKQVRRLARAAGVYSLTFLSDDRLAFAGTLNHDINVHIHEVKTGEEILPPSGHLYSVTDVRMSPDGQLITSAGSDVSVRLWDLEKVKQRHQIQVGFVPAGLGFYPGGKRAFYFGVSGSLGFVEVESGRAGNINFDKPHHGAVSSAVFTKDGRYVLTGGTSDGTVRMWQLQDGKQVRRFDLGPQEGAAYLSVAPDMRRVIRTGGSATRLLQLRCQQVVHEWPPVAWAPFRPDGQAVFFGGTDSPVWQISGEGVQQAGKINLNLQGLGPSHLSADGKRVATVRGGRVSVYDLATARPVWEWTPPNPLGGVRGLALSADALHLMTANGDGTIYVVRLP